MLVTIARHTPGSNFVRVALLAGLLGACGSEDQTGTTDSAADTEVFEVFLPDTFLPVDLSEPTDGVTPDGSDVRDTGEPDTAVCPGCTGAPCSTNSECNSGYCLEGQDGQECVATCSLSCPIGYGCRGVLGAGGDPVYLCIYEHVTFCQPCRVDRDCETGIGGLLGARCVELDAGDPTSGSFCRTPCSLGGTCPEGASCGFVDFDGVQEALCRPGTASEPGVCGCSSRSVSLELSTGCAVVNAIGTCEGERSCGASGLTACDARVPSPEVCNDFDDDCDGSDDEDFPTKGAACDGDDDDSCADGTIVCAPGGGLACTDDAFSRVELCNGLDDDCDLSVDEDFAQKNFPCDGDDTDTCADGLWICSADGLGLVCTDDESVREEVCNGVDDDCDGETDEDFPLKGQPCDSPVDSDLCLGGVYACDAGGLACTDDDVSIVELCNGLDDDCDGATDEASDLVPPLNGNQLGSCAGTVQLCQGAGGWRDNYSGVPLFGQNETPDASYLDENCDGIDGTEALGVFVRPGGANSGTCTKSNPCGGLTYAIAQANASRRHVYVQAGTYDGIVEVPAGKDVEVYGGFNTSWQRRPRTENGHTVTLRGAKHAGDDEYLTVRVRSATVRFADLVIVGPSPGPTERKNGRGYSTYAVHAVSSNVTLDRVEVQQGNAASGASGVAGTSAPSLTAPAKAAGGGGATQAVDTCNNTSRGGGGGGQSNGQCSAGTAGGTGGTGGVMDASCGCLFGVCVCTSCGATAGTGGTAGSGSSAGGGGNAGSGGSSCSGVGNGGPGGTAVQGGGGAAGARGGVIASGYWTGNDGANGTTGSAGSGGGGGGGSGGCDNNGGVPLQNSSGAGGGGGGAGGCAAQAGGTAGRAGGSSIGVECDGESVPVRARQRRGRWCGRGRCQRPAGWARRRRR
jgi:hypothetical protein